MTMSAAEKVDPIEEENEETEKAKQLPEPKGYKILIAMPGAEEKTEGGIIKAAVTRQLEEVGAMYGLVLKLGPDAYADKKRFPNGPYCEEGDLILMRSYSGTRFRIHGKEFRLINDDSVEAVIQDPRGLEKV
jgi:co-chaperonin GroES (HSP10)